jgi:hypothetical protein
MCGAFDLAKGPPMAHVQDRCEKIVDGERVRSARYGTGKRWRARYLDPHGVERTRAFDRKADALGHSEPGFTLRVYAHLFPSSDDRARKAVDRLFTSASDRADDAGGPT